MTLLYRHQRFLEHETGNHPEAPCRLEHVHRALDSSRVAGQCQRPVWQGADDQTLQSVHAAAHIEAVTALAARGGGRLDPDTVVSRQSADVARLAVGAACDAVQRVVDGTARNALCLCRPPGHHALPGRAMGFCLFNTIALAARWAVDQCRLDRVLVVDWDVHHGNGTQAAFYEDPRVGFFSAHRWPFYPGTGDADETGAGPGVGTTHNLPVRFGTSRREYITRFGDDLAALAQAIKPQLVLISAGFDSHAADPIGSLGLETEDFGELTRRVLDIASDYADGRVVSVLEGGYNPPVLAECVEVHLAALVAAAPQSAADSS